MLATVWGFLASAGMSVLAGLITLGLVIWRDKHRDANGRLKGARITLAVAQGASLYTLVICILGNWLFGIPISDTVRDGFSNQRMSWLMLALAGDIFVRIYAMFDPE